MKTLKIFLLSLILVLSLSTGVKAEFFTDVIVTSASGIWTDSRAYATLNAAITAVGPNQRTIKIVSPQVVTALTIPSNVTLDFERDGSITNSGLLTINTKNIRADNRQIFTGAGNIDFASGTIVKTGWFNSIESAFALTINDTVTLIVSKPQTITASYSPGNNVNLKWEAPGNILTVNAGVNVTNIGQVEAGNYQLFAGAGNFRFRDGTNLNSSWFAHLRTIITWVSTNKVTLTLSGTLLVDLTDTVPTNIHIDVDSQRGLFSVSGGVILTISSSIQAGPYQWFSDAWDLLNPFKGAVVLTSVERHYPEWYSSGTFTQATIEAALTAIGTVNKVTLLLRPGTWVISSNADWSAYINVTFKIVPGAKLSGAFTVNIPNPEAGRHQIFDSTLGVVTISGNVSRVYPEWWGADSTGAADSTAAVQAAIRTGKVVDLTTGATYKIATSVSSTLVNVHIEGNGAIFDGSTSAAGAANPLLSLGGAVGSSAALTTTFTAGATSLVTGLAGLVEHDLIHITSTDAWSAIVGSKGEIAEVKSVSGTTITLKKRTYDGYTNTTTTITKINAKKVIVRNLNIIRDSDTAVGLHIIYARDIEISGCSVKGARYTGIIPEYVYGGEIRNNYITDAWYTGTGNSYGIIVDSSQTLNIVGNRIFDAKHGVAHGGTYVNRDILLDGNYVDSKHGISNYAFDFHANSEFVTVINNTIFNSLHFECQNITIKNNLIYHTDSTYGGISGYLHGSFAYVDIDGNKIFATGTNARGINLIANTASATINRINISNNYVSSTYYGINIAPYDATITGFIIKDLNIADNTVIMDPAAPAAYPAVRVFSETAKLKVLKLNISGGYLYGSNYTVMVDVDATDGLLTIQNTKQESAVAAAIQTYVAAAHDIVVVGNSFGAGNKGLIVVTGRNLTIERNAFINALLNRGVEVKVDKEILINNNTFSGSLGSLSLTAGHRAIFAKMGLNAMSFGAAAPVAVGTWRKGDVINSTVAVGGAPSGWVCITSGTFSAATDNTGDTDGSTAVITGITDTSDFYVGDFVSVSAGFATTGPFEILRLTATTMTLDTNSNAAQNNVTVSTPDPTFAAMANL